MLHNQVHRRYISCRAGRHETEEVDYKFQHLTIHEPESCFAPSDSVRRGADDGGVLALVSGIQVRLQVVLDQARRSILTSFTCAVERATNCLQDGRGLDTTGWMRPQMGTGV